MASGVYLRFQISSEMGFEKYWQTVRQNCLIRHQYKVFGVGKIAGTIILTATVTVNDSKYIILTYVLSGIMTS